jgi:putative oxidoreductase
VKQAVRICRRVESAFSALQPAMRSAVGPCWGFRFAHSGWAKRRNRLRIMGFSLCLNAAFSVFDTYPASRVELTLEVLAMPGPLCRRGELPFAGDGFFAYSRAVRAALTPVFPGPGRFWVADPCSFVFRSLMRFILVTGLFSVDAQSTKKVRTAR